MVRIYLADTHQCLKQQTTCGTWLILLVEDSTGFEKQVKGESSKFVSVDWSRSDLFFTQASSRATTSLH